MTETPRRYDVGDRSDQNLQLMIIMKNTTGISGRG